MYNFLKGKGQIYIGSVPPPTPSYNIFWFRLSPTPEDDKQLLYWESNLNKWVIMSGTDFVSWFEENKDEFITILQQSINKNVILDPDIPIPANINTIYHINTGELSQEIIINSNTFQNGGEFNMFVRELIEPNFSSDLDISYHKDYNTNIPLQNYSLYYTIVRINNVLIIKREYYNNVEQSYLNIDPTNINLTGDQQTFNLNIYTT